MKISEKLFLTSKDIAEIIGTSEASAYRLIKELNTELKKKGKVIFPGKISRRYFEEKVYM